MPPRLDFDTASLGIARTFVSVRLENPGSHVVPIRHLHATFSATREGVGFPCNAHVAGPDGAIEPSDLAPGQSFTLERSLECTLALPGRYEIKVWLHVAEPAGQERDQPGGGLYAGAAELEVVAHANAPVALPSHPGLHVVLTGATMTTPMPADAWQKGGYQVAVALVNGTNATVGAGPGRIRLLVFKDGTGVPCAGRDEPLDEPPVLHSGEVHVVRVPVTCAPTEPGHYTVVGRFALGRESEVEVGRIGLLAIRSPDLLFTTDWPPLPPVPTP